ncbi:hypothetical protein EXE59_11395 [Nocardioides eburneiflavus]|uniref:Type IV toxin-antitoxin system AbiEi family antitoxin domain-containing protein n=1 Tax=Nocardioides eburneiflavus TaxID=2518372 RepID=A0A4Z1BT80_9ACTN|nr:hypothetical protein [Nocardioides eburneiflavus]TGN64501.1 hypothetical protein EXE59_11395 [Nocardioides eburneiflavus]
MHHVAPELLRRPITRARARAVGLTARVLEGVQFRRLHQGVYVHRSHEMTWTDHVEAARLALPATARTTGVTRLRQLGLDVGSAFPLHFVVEGDHHLVLDGVFLHRTVKMPPCDDVGTTVEAAFVAFCAEARLIDAIGLGSYLLHKEWLDVALLDQILCEEKWRRGVPETTYVLPHLEGRCRSIPEAELFAYVVFAMLPVPDVNRAIELRTGVELTPDLWFEDYGLAVEYEGSHHQDDRAQYNADIDRYSLYRRHDVPYEQVTKERMRSPRATVRLVHTALVATGYDGPPPDFGEQWESLFQPLSDLVRRSRAA